MRRTFSAAAVCFWVVLSATVAVAAPPGETPPSLPVDQFDSSAYPKVSARVTAPSSAGSISSTNFTVTENGKVVSVTAQRLPTNDLSVVLVLDTSSSMKGEALVAARRSAEQFVDSMPPEVDLAVVGFANKATVLSEFSEDRAATRKALAGLQARGNTSLYDAMLLAVGMHAKRPVVPDARNVILVLTDGGDTRSAATLSEVHDAVKGSGVSVSAVTLTTSETDLSSLSSIAAAGGGAAVSASDPTALGDVFRDVSDAVLNQYILTWQSTESGFADVGVSLAVGGTLYRSTQRLSLPVLNVPIPAVGEPESIVVPAKPLVKAVPVRNEEWLYLVGIGAGFTALLVALTVLLWPRPSRSRMLRTERGFAAPPPIARLAVFNKSALAQRVLLRVQRMVRRRDSRGRLLALLERAGSTMQPAELVVINSLACVATFLLFSLLSSVVVGILLALVPPIVAVLLIRIRADKRSQKFNDQFESTLQIMSNSLKAGYGITQAIDTVARESESPTSDEFRRVVRESRLGMDQITALDACAQRVACQDLAWVTDAIAVNRDVGGNLAELFESVSETIRTRQRLRRQVDALSTEGKFSAKILLGLPFVVMAWMLLTSRSYVGELLHGFGLVMIVLAVLSMVMGSIWLRRIVKIEY